MTIDHNRLLQANGVEQVSGVWTLLAAFGIFFMQCGFAMLEAGTVRAKNTRNILLKNLLDACIGALVWWAWGYGAAVRSATSAPPAEMYPGSPRDG